MVEAVEIVDQNGEDGMTPQGPPPVPQAQQQSRLERELSPEQLAILEQFSEIARQSLDIVREEQAEGEAPAVPEQKLEVEHYDYYLNRDQLIRFLRAREFNVQHTQVMYVAWVRWRLQYRADQIEPEEIRVMLERPVMALAGRTKDNCIVVLVQPRFHDPSTQQIDDLVRYGIFVIEKAIQRIEAEGLEPQIHCIYDRTGMGWANRDTALIKFALRMVSTLQDYYCERLGNFYVIGANWAYWAAHKLIKPFIAARTREKIKLIYQPEQLQEWIAPDNIIRELGGTLDYEYDPQELWGLHQRQPQDEQQ